IDANGILHVTAKEKTSGKESSIRIENTTTLDKTDVERMVKEAEQNADADKKRRERVEKRNTLDSLRVQALGQIEENGSAPQDAKDRLKAAADEAEEAVRVDDDAKIESAQKKLEEELRSFMTAAQQAGQGQGDAQGQPTANRADDDVIDADFKPAE
ncbi:Hsp70 family protein, partial [uncultured Deinococcus sp.]|uniref:Hsp70 family protein n=1 Tax=uncultured Deinococcus sp. TaxID=158789 RepID=UPI0026010173